MTAIMLLKAAFNDLPLVRHELGNFSNAPSGKDETFIGHGRGWSGSLAQDSTMATLCNPLVEDRDARVSGAGHGRPAVLDRLAKRWGPRESHDMEKHVQVSPGDLEATWELSNRVPSIRH